MREHIGYTVVEIAAKSGLSLSTVRRDIRRGHLTCLNGFDDYCIHRWLTNRNQRCNGLTIESKKWLEELWA